MTLIDLLEKLQELHEDGVDLNTPVMLAIQPNWPLRVDVGNVKVIFDENDRPVVWIAEGGHPYGENPYAPKEAWDE